MRRTLVGGSLLIVALLLASRVEGDPKAPAESAKEIAGLDERYAQAYLDLAKLEFEQATRFNKQVNSVLPSSMIDSLRESVVVAEGWLAEAKARQKGEKFNSYVSWAESLKKVADDNYQRFQAAEKRFPNSIDPADLKDRKLTRDLAKLRVERAKTLDIESPPDILRWEIHQLREEVLRLNNQVNRLTTRE